MSKSITNGQRLMRTFSGEIRAAEANESRRIELSFSSEQPYTRWFGSEILCHDEGCVELTRLKEIGTLLFHHGRDANYGSLPVGKIIDVTLDKAEKRCRATVEFDADEKSDLLYQKVSSGSVKGVSVGYSIDAYEEVMTGKTSSNGRFTGPCTVVTKWTPMEISIESVPADDSVGVGRSVNEKGDDFMAGEQNLNVNTTGEHTRTVTPPTAPVATTPPVVPAENERVLGAQQERARVTEISALCKDFGVSADGYIEKGSTVEEARAAVLEILRTRESGEGLPAANAEVTQAEEDKYRSAARDGMLQRMGFSVQKPAAGAREFIGMSLKELAKDCVARSGEQSERRLNDVEELMRSALVPNSAFVSVINNTMGAVLSDGYSTANTTFQQWAGKGSNPNFKASNRYRLSAAGDFYEIPQNGEFKNSEVTDEGVATRLKTFGKKFAFGRQTIIDDDLGTIARALQAQVRSNKRFINAKVYEALTASSSIYDGKALFHNDHKNLGTAGELSIETINELLIKMALQKDMSGKEQLNITPAFLLVPVALQMAAGRLIYSAADPSGNNSGVANPMQNKLSIIADAALDAKSAKAFYLAASPADVDTIEVTYLNGKEEPTLESNVSFERLGIEYRLYHDFSVSVLDYRGLAKNAGQ